MNVLALDTSTLQAVVAFAGDPAFADLRAALPDPALRHGRNLIPAIHDLLSDSGLRVRDLQAIGVGVGPGSYTGLRIGITAAKTFAYALSIPLLAIDSLEAIARSAPGAPASVCVVADAQRDDLYVADFRRLPSGALERIGPTRLLEFHAWREQLAPTTLVVGPGLARVPDGIRASLQLATPPVEYPAGLALLTLAHEALNAGRLADPPSLEPLYLRRSSAEEKWEALGR